MMKKVTLALALAMSSLTTQAIEFNNQVGVGINQVEIDWIGDTDFSVQMLTLEYTLMSDYGLGLRAQVGKSNSGDAKGGTYLNSEAKLKRFSTISMVYQYSITNKVGIEASYGMMDYDQAVTNFNNQDDYSNVDSGSFYSFGINYKISVDFGLRFNYSMYHDKTKWKESTFDGHEKTTGYNVTITYNF